MLSDKWIRTTNGHAGRNGYIIPCTEIKGYRFKFIPYDGGTPIHGERVGQLKSLAKAVVNG